MMYEDWGFHEPPFQTTPLPSSQLGAELLVGRSSELKSIKMRIGSTTKMATIEGLNGVGKTSIINVASYMLYEDHITDGGGPLFIPCRKSFQLDPLKDISEFVDEVFMEVAQTIIDRATELKTSGSQIKTKALDRWLNSAQLSSYAGGVWLLSGGKQQETNTSDGFSRSGFRKEVTSMLEQVFPTVTDGGVICIIDNVELLRTSKDARIILEKLRDELFNQIGLRWVLSGALGIIMGAVASPRLDGYVHQPVEIGEVDPSCADEILSSRINRFRFVDEPYMPLLPGDFVKLYELLRGNLRSILSMSDDFCHWVFERSKPASDDQKSTMFNQWLIEQASSAYSAVKQQLRQRALTVFEQAITVGGVLSPSDFKEFGFENIAGMRPHIRDLEDAGIMVSSQDEGDKRRKTIQITSKGYLIDFARRGNL